MPYVWLNIDFFFKLDNIIILLRLQKNDRKSFFSEQQFFEIKMINILH